MYLVRAWFQFEAPTVHISTIWQFFSTFTLKISHQNKVVEWVDVSEQLDGVEGASGQHAAGGRELVVDAVGTKQWGILCCC